MTDAVLDLSAKSSSEFCISRRSYSNSTPPSPNTPTHRESSSDDNENDSSAPSSAIRPVAGPVPTRMREDSPLSGSEINHHRMSGESPPSSPPSASSLSSRPFKSYPADAISSMFSSASSQLFNGQSMPTGLPGGLGLTSLYDNSSSFPSFPITPLTSHLLQRKRRAESRSSVNTDGSDETDSKKLKHVPEENKDGSYWERRRKNNEAAKRSRDTRRCKEEEIAMRAAFLEQENLKLRAQVAILKNETAKLHYMLYNRL